MRKRGYFSNGKVEPRRAANRKMTFLGRLPDDPPAGQGQGSQQGGQTEAEFTISTIQFQADDDGAAIVDTTPSPGHLAMRKHLCSG